MSHCGAGGRGRRRVAVGLHAAGRHIRAVQVQPQPPTLPAARSKPKRLSGRRNSASPTCGAVEVVVELPAVQGHQLLQLLRDDGSRQHETRQSAGAGCWVLGAACAAPGRHRPGNAGGGQAAHSSTAPGCLRMWVLHAEWRRCRPPPPTQPRTPPHQVGGAGEAINVNGHSPEQLAALQARRLRLELLLQGGSRGGREGK